MRYLMTGLGLFLLMTLFVRAWYVKNTTPPKVVVNESPKAPKDMVFKAPAAIYSGTIILQDNLLLKSFDYQEIEKAINALHKHPETKLDISTLGDVDSTKINSILRTILTDQGVLATRFQFLRKQTTLPKGIKILLRVH